MSSDSCGGGGVFLSADDTALVPGEINADSKGTELGGGSVQLSADTLTVGGRVHANGGGGEVNLQACTLTLGATGQTVATGPNGFNLLQASGPMEIEGTMTATVANTLDYLDPAHLPVLDYLDPAHLPVVQSSNISPPAVIVADDPAVPPLCPGQTTPTSTTSTTSTSLAVTTSTTVPTTTTLVVGTTTSTSTTTTHEPSSTTTSTISSTQHDVDRGADDPLDSRDQYLVNHHRDVDDHHGYGAAGHHDNGPGAAVFPGEPTTLDAASCGIQMLTDTVQTTAPTALGGSRTAHRLDVLLKQADQALDSVERGTKVKASLRKTRRALGSFESLVRNGLKRKRGAIEPQVGQVILGLVTDATTSIGEMQARIR